MKLKSSNNASSINNYQPVFTPCYHQGELRIALRSYDKEGEGYYLLVDPTNFSTSLVLKGEISPRKEIVNPNEIGYFTKRALKETPYGLARDKVMQGRRTITNDGITHSMQEHELNQVFLTIDLCPSRRVFERDFFEKLVSMAETKGKAIPIAICITEFWLRAHQEEFQWLLSQQQENKLEITWVNHSATHVYYHDCTSEEGLTKNFLLAPETNLAFELFEIEKELIASGVVPSVFFRAPGLVTNTELIEYLNRIGLITLGADAWLAKEEEPRSGSIILVHGNSNEPKGIELMMPYLESDTFDFLPLCQAFPAFSEVTQYLSAQPVSEKAGEETDDEADEELHAETNNCLPESTALWHKPEGSKPGTRCITFKEASERLALFRRLKVREYEPTQKVDSSNQKKWINVRLPTVSI